MPKFPISSKNRKVTVSILEKVEKYKNKDNLNIISYSRFYELLNREEKNFVIKLQNKKPSKYGFKGKFLGGYEVPENLIAIRNQKFISGKGTEKIKIQYLTKPLYYAYKKLNAALLAKTKRKLLISSGYRSPACQAITFLTYLKLNKFNFEKTVKRVAFPGYSEHGYPKSLAVDFVTANGIPDDNKPLEFAKTVEYKWLMERANEFGFYESYPKNNRVGVMFEPWHWQFRK